MNDIWTRLKDIRLFRALAVFFAGAWVALQVAAFTIDRFGFPEWTLTVTLVLLGIGLAVILATAWIKTRVARRDAAGLESSGGLRRFTWRRALAGGGFAFSILFGLAGLWVVIQDRGRSFAPDDAHAEAAPAVAVLPFEAAGVGLESWREGAIDLISTNLDGAGGLRARAADPAFLRSHPAPAILSSVRLFVIPCLAALHAACASTPATAPPAAHDVLIAGGTVVDGTGAAGVRADVAIAGDRIVAIGTGLGAARDTLDATGHVVAPGFIDMLGHSEFRLLADGRAISKITQGVTSEITGEVSSVVPASERPREERRSEIEPWGVEYTWDDLDGYFARLESQGTAINLGTWVGLSSLRIHGVGGEDRPATDAEMGEMRRALGEAMAQGAFGLSSGLIYAPGRHATTDEIVELARVVADSGGFYATHMRSEGDRLLEAIDEAIEIGERSGAPVLIHHLKASGKRNWGRMSLAVERIQAARDRGLDVMASVYPYIASSTGLDQILPGWVSEGGTEATLARLSDPALRDSIEAELSSVSPTGDWALGTSAGGPSGVQVSDVVVDSLESYEGMRLDAIAEARGQSAAAAAIDLLVADSLRTSAIYFSMSEDDLVTAMRQPWVVIGGDAGVRALDGPLSTDQPHPRAFGTFPRILCRYSREMGVFPMEEAVRRMTSLPAARAGLPERGVLQAGHFADVTVFDPATVCDRATFESPKELAVGIRHVLVNGVPVMRDGAPTGARPGRGLRAGPVPGP